MEDTLEMNCKYKNEISNVKRIKPSMSWQLSWIIFIVWLMYSAMMLWHFKEQTNLNLSVCKVAR